MSGLVKSFKNPLKSITHLVKNPSSAIVPKGIRNSSAYKNIARPVIKVGVGAAVGFVASGFNPAGAIAGGVTSAIGGGLTNNAFRPLPNLVGPAVVGAGLNPTVQNAAAGLFGQTGPGAGASASSAYSQAVAAGSSPASAAQIAVGQASANAIGTGSTLGQGVAGGLNYLVNGGIGSSVLSGGKALLGGGSGGLLNTLGQIGGAVYSSSQARRAAQIQADAAAAANKTQWAMFNQNRADIAPWQAVGESSLGQLGAETLGPNAPLTRAFGTADFQADPGYQFRKSEGQKAIDHQLGSIGMHNSGQSVKEAARFNQDIANQAYQGAYNRFNSDQTNRFNRLNSLSGTGVNAAGRIAGLGANAASNSSNITLANGRAQANGRINSSNAYLNALNNIQGISAQNNQLNRLGGVI